MRILAVNKNNNSSLLKYNNNVSKLFCLQRVQVVQLWKKYFLLDFYYTCWILCYLLSQIIKEVIQKISLAQEEFLILTLFYWFCWRKNLKPWWFKWTIIIGEGKWTLKKYFYRYLKGIFFSITTYWTHYCVSIIQCQKDWIWIAETEVTICCRFAVHTKKVWHHREAATQKSALTSVLLLLLIW